MSFLASVNHTGTSSMEAGIEVIAQDIRSPESRHASSCLFAMVAVDDDRKPCPSRHCDRFLPKRSGATRPPSSVRSFGRSLKN